MGAGNDLFNIVCVESEKDSQLENVHVSSYRQHPQLKLVDKFGNLNSIKQDVRSHVGGLYL